MCRYGIFIYTIPLRTMLALHCCCRMSGFRHFVLCQQCYIHIASIQGEQGDGDEGGDGRVAEEAEAERGHIAAAHRATEPHHPNLGWRRNWENVRLSTDFNIN